MSDHCENCGQKILATDTVCWHCGWHLAESQKSSVAGDEPPAEPHSPDFSLSHIAAYAGLTLLLLIAVLWTMQSLGRYPQKLLGTDISLIPGWTLVVNQDRSFALQLPARWRLVEAQDNLPVNSDLLANREQRIGGLLTLLEEAGHTFNLLALATQSTERHEAGASFLLISSEAGPDAISPDGAMEILRSPDFSFVRAILSTESSGQINSTLFFDTTNTAPNYRCQARFTRKNGSALLLTACAPQAQFSGQAEQLQAIIDSFQLAAN